MFFCSVRFSFCVFFCFFFDPSCGAKRNRDAQAMAQSVRGLRQSAALCGHEELPLTMDLLQGSEAVAAVLCRCARVFGG